LDDFGTVEPIFQRIIARLVTALDLSAAVDALPAAERAIVATRVLEGDVDNDGWYQLFGNRNDGMIEPSISGYETLGLTDYAAVLRDVRSKGFNEASPAALGDELDAVYFALSGSEAARAALVKWEGMGG
jgi:hypothetical protein